MSNFLISFLVGAGFGTWCYSKLMRSTGGNTKSSAMASAILGVVAFLIMLLITSMLIPGGSTAPTGDA